MTLSESICTHAHNYLLKRKTSERRLEIIKLLENIDCYIRNPSEIYINNIEKIISNNYDAYDYLYRLFFDLEKENISINYLILFYSSIIKYSNNLKFKITLRVTMQKFSLDLRYNPNIDLDYSFIKFNQINVLNYLNEENPIISLTAINDA